MVGSTEEVEMKITKRQLKRVIREEKQKLLEESGGVGIGFSGWSVNKNPDFAKAYGKDARVLRDFGSNSTRQNRLNETLQDAEERLTTALDEYVSVLDESLGYDIPTEQLKAEVMNLVDGHFEFLEDYDRNPERYQ
jgi:hypothetical protein